MERENIQGEYISAKYTKCLDCGHEWGTKSFMQRINCPSCHKKMKNPHAPRD